MLDDVREQVTRYLANIEFRATPEDVPPPPQIEMQETRRDPALDMEAGFAQSPQLIPIEDDGAKVQRNAPCPCGSGKKYKHCHGAAV
jgi:preprotein translocase subunit SecA